MMGTEGIVLSAETEDWDDSECIATWDSAVDEYKKYHSIRARGITIDQAVREFEAEEQERARMKQAEKQREKEERAQLQSEHLVQTKGEEAKLASSIGLCERRRDDVDITEEGDVDVKMDCDDGETQQSGGDGRSNIAVAFDSTIHPPSLGGSRSDSDPTLGDKEAARETVDVLVGGIGGAAAAPPSFALNNMPGMDEATKNLMMSWYYAGYYTGLYEGQRQAQSAVVRPSTTVSTAPTIPPAKTTATTTTT